MATHEAPQDPRKVAEELLNRRLDAVDRHAANVREEQQQREALSDAQKETARSWAELLGLGWLPEELKRMGFKEPTVKGPGRPRSRGRTAPKVAPAAENIPPQPSSVTAGKVPEDARM